MIPDLLPPDGTAEKLFFRRAESLLDVIPLIADLNGEKGIDSNRGYNVL
jgi:hypothetical protein